MISDKDQKEIKNLIFDASRDLDEYFCKIKKSKKILKYMDNGNVIHDIFIYIISNFSITQILEYSHKSKMLHEDVKSPLNRKERFKVAIEMFKGRFDYIYQQHLEIIEKNLDGS